MTLVDDVSNQLIGTAQTPVGEILIISFACVIGFNMFTYFEYVVVVIINTWRGK